jgi:hypothetical protein
MLNKSFSALVLALFAGSASAQVDYEVTITNITPGQSFTPQHREALTPTKFIGLSNADHSLARGK